MDRERILIVDDDKNICELLRLYLEKEGYETAMAHDGESALTVFDEKYFDLDNLRERYKKLVLDEIEKERKNREWYYNEISLWRFDFGGT